MTDRQFRLFVASIVLGIVLAFAVPLVIYGVHDDAPTVEIRPDPAIGAPAREPGRRREPVLRASRRPMSYSPLEDM